jgi:WhiB family transcriptional regulator, redox-sensing transcriptional regulator
VTATTMITGRQRALRALPALSPKPSVEGPRTVMKTVSKRLCMNGDGGPVHGRDRCKHCYDSALWTREIVVDQGPPIPPFSSPAWTVAAACKGHDPEKWFPGNGVSPEAKRICAGCEVREPCLDRALSLSCNPQGIWGGTSETEREPLRRARKRGVAA